MGEPDIEENGKGNTQDFLENDEDLKNLRELVFTKPLGAPEAFKQIVKKCYGDVNSGPEKADEAARILVKCVQNCSIFKKRMMAEEISKLDRLSIYLFARQVGDTSGIPLEECLAVRNGDGRVAYVFAKPESDFVLARGNNEYGQLGVGSDEKFVEDLTRVKISGEIRNVYMGTRHSIFLMKNGDAYGCGVISNFKPNSEKEKDSITTIPIKLAQLGNYRINPEAVVITDNSTEFRENNRDTLAQPIELELIDSKREIQKVQVFTETGTIYANISGTFCKGNYVLAPRDQQTQLPPLKKQRVSAEDDDVILLEGLSWNTDCLVAVLQECLLPVSIGGFATDPNGKSFVFWPVNSREKQKESIDIRQSGQICQNPLCFRNASDCSPVAITPKREFFNYITPEMSMERRPESRPLTVVGVGHEYNKRRPVVYRMTTVDAYIRCVYPELLDAIDEQGVLDLNEVCKRDHDPERFRNLMDSFFLIKHDIQSLIGFEKSIDTFYMAIRLPRNEIYRIQTIDNSFVQVPNVLFELFSEYDGAKRRYENSTETSADTFDLPFSEDTIEAMMAVVIDRRVFFEMSMEQKMDVFRMSRYCIFSHLNKDLLRMIVLTAEQKDNESILELLTEDFEGVCEMIGRYRLDLFLFQNQTITPAVNYWKFMKT
ncbi:hypothetical protein GCK72_020835 [Caenorhabditis remanei]|uniref:Uncharacterized protein n=1 Tax=Caenorhabditis remanei TaxID=31234 RepID=A0A6A5GI93_CAERE|nr:hypothetical protein GCK72_020835 [Caenorhabditis remanei]KAF1754275.1 hypothetical protein GCK72_020835 [Caenorhabditis remanei]